MNNKIVAVVVAIIIISAITGYLGRDRIKSFLGGSTTDLSPAVTTEQTPLQTSSGLEATGGASTAGTVKEFTVDGANYKFTPSLITVNKGDTVRITFKNGGGTHNLTIPDYNAQTKTVNFGGSDTVEFVADKAGSFEYYCAVGNHRELGMRGTLTVK